MALDMERVAKLQALPADADYPWSFANSGPLTFSAATLGKATRLVESGSVRQLDDVGRDFRVVGDHGTYAVSLVFNAWDDLTTAVCSCPLSIHSPSLMMWCSHVAAALKTIGVYTKEDRA